MVPYLCSHGSSPFLGMRNSHLSWSHINHTHQSINLVWSSSYLLESLDTPGPAWSLPRNQLLLSQDRWQPSAFHALWQDYVRCSHPAMSHGLTSNDWICLLSETENTGTCCNDHTWTGSHSNLHALAHILDWRRTGKRTETPEDAGLCSDSEVSSNICMICLN